MAKTGSAERERYWQDLIGQQRASGQSIVGFCADMGVSKASFHRWKRTLRRTKTARDRRARRPTLVPVRVVGDRFHGEATLEVQWPGGIVMRVGGGCDAQTIGAVMSALAAPVPGGPSPC